MEITGQTSTATPAPTPTGAAKSSAKLAENFDQFLTLLTTQLRYQDPLSPLESNEFVAQLVQFTGVEQSISLNQKLDKLIALQSGNQTVAALDLIGRSVEIDGTKSMLQGSQAKWAYDLPEHVSQVTLTVLNAANQPVYASAGEITTGKHAFAWNGKDTNGVTLPAGSYQLRVSAIDELGEPVEAKTTAFGRVTGVESGATGVTISIGDVSVPMDGVLSVHDTIQQGEG